MNKKKPITPDTTPQQIRAKLYYEQNAETIKAQKKQYRKDIKEGKIVPIPRVPRSESEKTTLKTKALTPKQKKEKQQEQWRIEKRARDHKSKEEKIKQVQEKYLKKYGC